MNDFSIFKKYFSNNRLSHAYILSGSAGSDKEQLAHELACAVVCSDSKKPCGMCSDCRKAMENIHPDIGIISREKDKSEIFVAQIRALKADAVIFPNDSEKKVYIIKEAETMNPPAQNALLKLLEEPPVHCCFILVTENSGSLLQTVRSRCVEIRLTELIKTKAANERAVELVDIFTGENKEIILNACFELEKLNRNEFFELCEDMKLNAMEKLKAAKNAQAVKLMELISILEKIDIYSTYNVGVGHTIGLLMAELV